MPILSSVYYIFVYRRVLTLIFALFVISLSIFWRKKYFSFLLLWSWSPEENKNDCTAHFFRCRNLNFCADILNGQWSFYDIFLLTLTFYLPFRHTQTLIAEVSSFLIFLHVFSWSDFILRIFFVGFAPIVFLPASNLVFYVAVFFNWSLLFSGNKKCAPKYAFLLSYYF